MHKFAKRAARYEGYPGLQRYSEFYDGSLVPSPETLQERISQLDRYLATKNREQEQIVAAKGVLTQAADELGPIVGRTIRMALRRTHMQLMHDIKELQAEQEMVQNALRDQVSRTAQQAEPLT